MAAFDYKALTAQGKTLRGVIEADSSRQARQQLREKGLTPLELAEGQQRGMQAGRFGWMGPGLPAKSLALVTRQMSTLIQAGLPLEEVLRAIAQQSENSRIESIVLAVRAKVLEGHSLAQSLAEYPRAFPRLYRATVAAGEHSGYLDKVMERLAEHTEDSQQFRQKIQMAMIYPCLLILLSITMVSGLMVYVVPDVIKVFVGSGQALPPLTVGLVALSDFIVDYGWLLLLLLLLGAIVIYQLLRQPAIRLRWHRQLLHLPFIRRFSRGFNTARYVSTLSILTSSGLPLVEGMRISTDVLGNEYLQQELRTATRRVQEGSSLHQALAESGYFPPMMLHMIASGETTGDLDVMLERTATYQSRDLQNLVTVLVGLFEPLMLLFMGVAVLLIVMAILLPILNMNQLVG
ncbi:type II secretion system inner membrane protein GspF [Pseudomaricurvus alcaniphilus]|uniref:type II secretion system inner membrane protein GspF n=1 Tax=Pseudomaricurvus alcaniphilus TaxID=1166482 RepID=UPI0014074A4F|nr:type II secretion system inner membrane protein GspF [Pseudomaricurvus alcaniphilus]NHN38924.1 type II secretion system inner membrane protein GspF [Pseudomaricurvus alcaniphilus]